MIKKTLKIIISLLVFSAILKTSNMSFAESNIIYSPSSKGENSISPLEKELHNWEKVSDNQYEVYNMFFDEYDANGNLILQNNYYRAPRKSHKF